MRNAAFSLFTSKTGKRVFQTGRVLVSIIAYVSSQSITVYGIEICLILVHFIQIVLPLTLYECKDQHLGKQM